MLEKLVQLKNIGTFADYSAAGDVQFRKLTLLYAENGRGKTTLCDLLRSLQTGEAGYLEGRRTLGAQDPPTAHLRADGQSLRFQNGAWNGAYPKLEIYDSTFVHDNVYAGDYVDHEQKKNLYRIIVGEHGVRLAREVEALDAASRDAQRDLNTRKGAVAALVPTGMTLEAFLDLQPDDAVDTKIAEKEREIAALQSSADIRGKDKLSPLALPSLPPALVDTLAKTLPDVSADAERQVQAHIAAHLRDTSSHAWLSQGMRYLEASTACPFCAQDISGNTLVAAYQSYFSAGYAALKDEVAAIDRKTEDSLGHARLLPIQATLGANATLASFWSQFVTVDLPELSFDDIRSPLDSLRASARRLLGEKARAPLEPIGPSEELTAALAAYTAISEAVRTYNPRVEAANAGIVAQKTRASTGNLEAEQRALQTLQAIKARYEPRATDACQQYQGAVAAKTTIEQQKSRAKESLDQHSTQVLARHEDAINELLDLFGAGFRIVDVSRRYAGGSASSTYRLLINNVPVELGYSRTAIDSPAFKNTLSAGDRSTLALAFFIAKLNHDPALSEKTVLFDDPFNSQDRSRRTRTQQQVCKILDRAAQVVVFSHDPAFLQLIWNECGLTDRKPLQLFRLGTRNTGISEWDISEATRGDYFENHKTLTLYLHEGSGAPRHVVRCIRPLLESYLRFKLPRQFRDDDWLGDMIGAIRDSDAGSPVAQAKAILDDLGDINQYSRTYHHDQNPAGADTEPISDGELTGYVRKTLDLVGGF